MKNSKTLIIFTIIFICSALLTACQKADSTPDNDRSGYERYEFSTIAREDGFEAFAVHPSGGILVSAGDGSLCSYDLSGELLTENTSGSFYKNFCYDGEKCYAYDYHQSAIVEFSGDTPRVITNSILLQIIRNMVALDGKIYVLGIPFTEESHDEMFVFGAQDFENYGETIYCIDAENGTYTTLPLKNIIAECRTESGEIYFYGWEEDKYYLYLYDDEKGKVTKKYHKDNMRNSLAVAVDGGYFFAMTPDAGLIAIDLQTGEETSIAPQAYTLFGDDLQFSRGNVLLYDMGERALTRAAFVAQDGRLEVCVQEHSSDAETAGEPQKSVRDETIVVSGYANVYRSLKTGEIRNLTGMKTKLVDMPLDYESIVTELMAGNSDVDIYLLGTSSIFARQCRDLGIYESLQGSDIIRGYLESCLASAQQAAKAENGDIWMLPLDIGTDMTWYVEENMEKFGLSPEDLGTAERYLQTLEQLQGNTGEYRYYSNALSFIFLCDSRYDLNYNDFANKKVDYFTDLYRWLAGKLWTGWDINSETPFHPLFHVLAQDYGSNFLGDIKDAHEYDKTRVIFKTDYDKSLLSYDFIGEEEINEQLAGWRAMPVPVLSDPSEKLSAGLAFALLNPYGRQKEAALAYLEALVTGGARTYNSPTSIFLREDLEAHESIYDTSLPVIRDMHEIYSQAVIELGYIWAPYTDYINEYQLGLISLDEALEKKQRQVEASLME